MQANIVLFLGQEKLPVSDTCLTWSMWDGTVRAELLSSTPLFHADGVHALHSVVCAGAFPGSHSRL